RRAARSEADRPTRGQDGEVGTHRRRQLGGCDPRGARPARAEWHSGRLLPDTRLPIRRRGGRVRRAAPANLRGRAKPRRAAQEPAHDRARLRAGALALDPAIRRLADRLPLRRRDARAGSRARGSRMTSIAKPKIVHPGLKRNALGLTTRDYEGSMSTLCAGCGHDSITAAIVQAFFELDIAPHAVAKMSGIGCSSKTPAYFLSASHGFNAVHGR